MAPLPPGKLTVIAYLYIFSDSVFSLEGTLLKHVPYSTKPVFICHCLNFDGWQQPVFGQRALRTMCTLLAAGRAATPASAAWRVQWRRPFTVLSDHRNAEALCFCFFVFSPY